SPPTPRPPATSRWSGPHAAKPPTTRHRPGRAAGRAWRRSSAGTVRRKPSARQRTAQLDERLAPGVAVGPGDHRPSRGRFEGGTQLLEAVGRFLEQTIVAAQPSFRPKQARVRPPVLPDERSDVLQLR